jgi:hypothetical protein
MQFTLAAALATLSLAAAQGTPDKPVQYLGYIYNQSASCGGSPSKLYLSVSGNCINYAAPGAGSARLFLGSSKVEYFSGWTGPDCTGDKVFVTSSHLECKTFGGKAIASFSINTKP